MFCFVRCSFLAASGLMKSPGSRTEEEISSPDSLESPLAETPGNSTGPADPELSKVEEMR